MSPKKKKIRHESPLTGQATGTISSAASKSKRRKKPNSEKPLSKKAQFRARKEALEAMEEERLTAMLFGGGITKYDGASSSPVPIDNDYEENNLDEEASDGENEIEENLKFEIDRGGDQSYDNDADSKEEEFGQAWNDEDDDDDTGEHAMVMDDDNDNDDDDDEDSVQEDAAPAWEDPDDSKTALIDGNSRLKKLRRSRQETEALSSHELEQRLRERYEASSQSTARTDWATKTKDRKIKNDDDDEDNDEAALALFSTSKSLLASSRNQLPANILNLVRCPDANLADPNKAVVRCIDFHPASDPGQPLMLTAGLDKTLRFFQIGEERSEKIHGIHCKFLKSRSLTNFTVLLHCTSSRVLCFTILTIISSRNANLQCFLLRRYWQGRAERATEIFLFLRHDFWKSRPCSKYSRKGRTVVGTAHCFSGWKSDCICRQRWIRRSGRFPFETVGRKS